MALLLGILITLLVVGGIAVLFVMSLTREAEVVMVVNAPSALPPGEMPGNNPPPNDGGRRGRGGATMRESPPQGTGKRGDSAKGSTKPDATPPTLLGEEVPVGAYRVRAPKGYVAEKLAQEGRTNTYRWKGPGGGAEFKVSLTPASAETNLETLLEREIGSAAFGSYGLGWSCTLAEPTTINGLRFMRASWKAEPRPHKPGAAGVVFAALDGADVIHISFHEPAPSPAGDEAARSFHKAAK
jgi:hypothetical protein